MSRLVGSTALPHWKLAEDELHFACVLRDCSNVIITLQAKLKDQDSGVRQLYEGLWLVYLAF